MIRVLEFIASSRVKPVGGPAGYVYNLTNGCSSESIQICFLHPVEEKLKVKIKSMVFQILKVVNDYLKIYKLYHNLTKDINLNDYDVVHFHSTHDLFSVRKLLEGYQGKTILTSHSPKPLHQEFVYDLYSDMERRVLEKYALKKYEYVDEYAFDHADYILFPCEYAEEPYINNWDKYEGIKEKNRTKYIYMETGVIKKTPRIPADKIRIQYGLEGKFVLSFAGRHNEVKGYDRLKEFGEKLLKKHDDFSFVVCGNESPISGLKHERWMEIGWTQDADSYIASSDAFVLPNKETYFDLVMLEVLSMGKIVIASYTGGNKYFERFGNSGIFLYRSDEEFYQIVDSLYHMPMEERRRLENRNFEIYRNFFDQKHFFERYEQIISEII